MDKQIYLNEVFDSIQGEGLYIGKRQLFIRLTGCNLKCEYCDTQKAMKKKDSFNVIFMSNNDNNMVMDNPISGDKLVTIINTYYSHIDTISFTGGEPLIHYEFLKELLIKLNGKYRILLETNGTLLYNLSKIIDYIDIISMDIKPISAIGENYYDQQLDFLRISSKKDVYVKLVVTNSLTNEDICKAFSIVEAVDKDIPLILQPVAKPSNDIVKISKLIKIMDYGKLKINDVRLIPQVHKILEID